MVPPANEASDAGAIRQRRLIVVVPSISDLTEPWDDLINGLKGLPGYGDDTARWHRTHHGANWLRPGRAGRHGEALAANIHQQWLAGGGYDSVVLVGHSFGGVLVRYAYLQALGTFGADNKREWANKVERVVLFASLNRGVKVSFERRWWLPPVAWAARVLPVTRHWLAHDLLQGSEFITNLRIAWLREINALDRPPVMVQYLGTSDKLVGAEDSRDIDTFPTGTQEDVPNATHTDLIRLDTAPDRDARFALIAQAFTKPQPTSVESTGDPEQRVVIVLHGIRASNNAWPRELERHLETTYAGTEAIAATYGRFSARKFMIPVTRRKFLSWMQDTYAERLAANPRATFHFIGHSNGTYLLGHSLDKIPAMRFDRILLAGSVLPTSYDWKTRFDSLQVQQLRNDRAASDLPVGVLCSAMRGLFMRDIGTGGVDGFAWEDPRKTEVAYYRGGHSAAVASENLPHLARFVMDGTGSANGGLIAEPSKGFSRLSHSAPLIAWLVVLCLVGGSGAITAFGPWTRRTNAAAVAGSGLTVFVALDLA